MRKFICLILLCCSSTVWAEIVEVHYFGTWTARPELGCTSGCTDYFAVTFQFDLSKLTTWGGGAFYNNAWAVPGSLTVSGSGFLSSFTSTGLVVLGDNETYMPFTNAAGDELDLGVNPRRGVFPQGTDTVPARLYLPSSDEGREFLFARGMQPGFQTSSVVSVPEPGSLAMLLTGLGGMLVFRRRWGQTSKR